MSSAGRGLLAAVAGLALALGVGETLSVIERADENLFDAQVNIVRAMRDPQGAGSVVQQVVVVGIDESSLAQQGVPMGLLHAALGRALQAIAGAGPRAIGLDLALPERSFDHLVAGLDSELMRGLVAARAAGGAVLALDVDAAGQLRIPPAPLLAAAGGAQAFGLALFPVDCDGVVRRFDPDPAATAQRYGTACLARDKGLLGFARAHQRQDGSAAPAPLALPTFAARVASRLGREHELRQAGWIDFTRGGAFSYVPLSEVLSLHDRGQGAALRRLFGGQIVLLGSVLAYVDRLQLPVALCAWESAGTAQPGVILTAQLLRNVASAGLLRPAPVPVAWALLGAMVALAWIPGPWLRWCALLAALLGAFASAAALLASGWVVEPAQGMLAGAAAVIARSTLDLASWRRERERLRRALGGYLSPHLLTALLAGEVDTRGTRRAIALLFADLRNFTSWSETVDPELVGDTLSRYYGSITPVLHAHGGTIDNFRGDGVMVMFGAPHAQSEACDQAFAAARQIFAAVEELNRGELLARGVGALQISVGLAFGEVVVGDVGSSERKDYTALGDAVNVAARLQDLAKTLGVAVLMTQAFAQRLSQPHGALQELGLQPLKGHSPVAVCGWLPPQLASVSAPQPGS
ncbi:MAG TPA: CHASE2 domain-containing protein [Burkholderiaceae bacterium]|nr:CHASE2 domain-containing protein [Burkholderiaceae bacterium]